MACVAQLAAPILPVRTCDLRLSVSPTIEKQSNKWAIVILGVSGAFTAYQYRITKTQKLTLKYG